MIQRSSRSPHKPSVPARPAYLVLILLFYVGPALAYDVPTPIPTPRVFDPGEEMFVPEPVYPTRLPRSATPGLLAPGLGDPAAAAILESALAKMDKVLSYTALCEIAADAFSASGPVYVSAPNRYRIELTTLTNMMGQAIPSKTKTISDGVSLWLETTSPLNPTGVIVMQGDTRMLEEHTEGLTEMMGLSGPSPSQTSSKELLGEMRKLSGLRQLPDAQINGRPVKVLEGRESVTVTRSADRVKDMRWSARTDGMRSYIDTETGFPLRIEMLRGNKTEMRVDMSMIQLNPPLPPETFMYAPPQGAQVFPMAQLLEQLGGFNPKGR